MAAQDIKACRLQSQPVSRDGDRRSGVRYSPSRVRGGRAADHESVIAGPRPFFLECERDGTNPAAPRAPASPGRLWCESRRARGARRHVDVAGDLIPPELRGSARRRRLQDRAAQLRQRDRARRLRHQHRRRPPAVVVPDGAFAAPAPGEDGALLAQPLRHRLQQDRRRRRRGAGHQDAGAQGRGAAGPARPAGDLSRLRAGQLSRSPDRSGQGPGDAGVAGWPPEHAAAAAGELRPRDHGAVHVRHRQLHGGGRVCRGPRVHRMEPAAS